MAAPINTPVAGEIWHLSIEDLFAPVQETQRLGGDGPFVINLSVSTAPISQPAKSFISAQVAHVYQIQVIEDGRTRYRLRIGSFADEDQADAVLADVREMYPGALTATAGPADMRAVATLQAKRDSLKAPAKKPAAKSTELPPAAAPPVAAAPVELPKPKKRLTEWHPAASREAANGPPVAATPLDLSPAWALPVSEPVAPPKLPSARIDATVQKAKPQPTPAAPPMLAPILTEVVAPVPQVAKAVVEVERMPRALTQSAALAPTLTDVVAPAPRETEAAATLQRPAARAAPSRPAPVLTDVVVPAPKTPTLEAASAAPPQPPQPLATPMVLAPFRTASPVSATTLSDFDLDLDLVTATGRTESTVPSSPQVLAEPAAVARRPDIHAVVAAAGPTATHKSIASLASAPAMTVEEFDVDLAAAPIAPVTPAAKAPPAVRVEEFDLDLAAGPIAPVTTASQVPPAVRIEEFDFDLAADPATPATPASKAPRPLRAEEFDIDLATSPTKAATQASKGLPAAKVRVSDSEPIAGPAEATSKMPPAPKEPAFDLELVARSIAPTANSLPAPKQPVFDLELIEQSTAPALEAPPAPKEPAFDLELVAESIAPTSKTPVPTKMRVFELDLAAGPAEPVAVASKVRSAPRAPMIDFDAVAVPAETAAAMSISPAPAPKNPPAVHAPSAATPKVSPPRSGVSDSMPILKRLTTRTFRSRPTAPVVTPPRALPPQVVASVKLPPPRDVRQLSQPLMDLESTQTVRALTAPELENDTGLRWYVIQLSQADQAFDPDAVPNLDIFGEYRLYSVAGLDQGQVVHSLRLGFFTEEIAAVAVSSYLAAYYENPTIRRVSVAERERFADQRVEARKDVGATGRHAVIEITNELVARYRRSSSTTSDTSSHAIAQRIPAPR